MIAQHISTVPLKGHHSSYMTGERSVEPHGLCRCAPQPDSSPFGECPRCHRLDGRKSAVEFVAAPPASTLVGAVAPPARAVMPTAWRECAPAPTNTPEVTP
jgi:hypothetical protein